VKEFNPHSSHPARVVQAWQILIGLAKDRKSTTYEELSVLMYRKEAAGVLNAILGHVAFYCQDHGLPHLTVIVVEKDSGRPGAGIPVDSRTIDQAREDVYGFDWYNVYPPSEEELAAAHDRHKKNS
jgi:hypothetical protein